MPARSKERSVRTEDVAAVIAPGVQESAPARRPRFGMCEGTREELARTGKAVDPFTGKTLTRDDLK